MNNRISKKTISAFKYTLIFKSLGQLCGILATIILVRILSENNYGIYNIFYSVIGFISIVASFGLGNTLERYMPEYYQKREFFIAHNLYKTSAIIRIIADTAILCFIFLFWKKIAPLLKIEDYKTYFLLFTLVILLHQQRNLLEISFSSFFLHKYSKPISFIFSIVKMTGYGVIIIFDESLWYAIIVDILSYAIAFISLKILYFKKIPISGGNLVNFSKMEKKRITKYAFFYNFNDAGVGVLNANFDNFIIVMLLNPVAVGAYSFCVRLSTMILSLLPLNYLSDVIRPAFFSIEISSEQNKQITLFFQSLVKMNFIFAIPFFFLLLISSKNIISILFNNKFIEYSSVLCGTFLFSVIGSIPVGIVGQFREKANIIFYSKIFAVYNLIADVILIYYFGIWGAVLATGTATIAKKIFIWYFVKEYAHFKGMRTFFIKILTFWSIVSIIIFYISIFLPSRSFIQLIVEILMFTIAFFIQFKCDYFKLYEKKIFATLVDKNQRGIRVLKILRMLPD